MIKVNSFMNPKGFGSIQGLDDNDVVHRKNGDDLCEEAQLQGTEAEMPREVCNQAQDRENR